MAHSARHNLSTQEAQTPKVSVVIPLYYAEDYIDDLLAQLRGQPLQEIEIICVIDGSPDGTLEIVKRHAGQDSRIQWLYQENAGAGAARNAGLERARGEYLAFLDADDLYDSQFLTKMYDTAVKHDADLVVCQYQSLDCKTGAMVSNEGFRLDRVHKNTVVVPQDLKNPFTDLSFVPNNKLYKRDMTSREGLRFSTTRVANDIFFVVSSVLSCRRIVVLQDCLIKVLRYANPWSITSNRAVYAEDVFKAFRDLGEWLENRGLYDCYGSFFTRAWSSAFHYNATFQRNDRFIELAAETLARDEPWASMDDRELCRLVLPDTGVIALKKALLLRSGDSADKHAELQRLENRVSAISDVVDLLDSKYGRRLPGRASVFAGIVSYLRDNGIPYALSKVARLAGKATNAIEPTASLHVSRSAAQESLPHDC